MKETHAYAPHIHACALHTTQQEHRGKTGDSSLCHPAPIPFPRRKMLLWHAWSLEGDRSGLCVVKQTASAHYQDRLAQTCRRQCQPREWEENGSSDPGTRELPQARGRGGTSIPSPSFSLWDLLQPLEIPKESHESVIVALGEGDRLCPKLIGQLMSSTVSETVCLKN